MVLGVVPRHDRVPELHLACVGRELAGHDAEERRLPGAVRPDDRDALAALHLRREAPVDDLRPERLEDTVEPHDLLARARRLGEVERERRALLAHLDLVHPVEHLLAALRLARLGRLGAEPVDEPLQLGAPRLLAPRRGVEPLLLLGAQALVVVVVARVAAQPLGLEREDAPDLPVQELAIVADEEERLRRAAQEGVEPGEGRDVEVVRRLVEEQQVGVLQEEPGQRRPHLPPARERAGGPPQVGGVEAEAAEDALGAVAPVPLLEVVQLRVLVRERLRELELLVRVARLVQRRLGREEPRLDRAAPGDRGEHHVDERALG